MDKLKKTLYIIFIWVFALSLLGMGWWWYLSASFERGCIRGAEKSGNGASEEVKGWCKLNF
jgi:hypothetical protein